MKFKIEFSKSAKKDILNLEKKIKVRIFDKLDFFLQQDNPLQYAKKTL